jgi:hypothetical protein
MLNFLTRNSLVWVLVTTRTASGPEAPAAHYGAYFNDPGHLVVVRVCSHLHYWRDATGIFRRFSSEDVRFETRRIYTGCRSESYAHFPLRPPSLITNNSVKYIALLALVKIVPSHPHLVAEYQDTILASVNDQDISIRMRALDLVSAMVRSAFPTLGSTKVILR